VTATVVIGIVVLIATISLCVSVAVIVFKIVSSVTDELAQQRHAHEAQLADLLEHHHEEQSGLLDRFQAIRWEDLAAMRAIEESDEGGFYPPVGDEDEPGQTAPGQFNGLKELNERMRLTSEEQQLLMEDFPEEMSAES
jgi:hypothetical protein